MQPRAENRGNISFNQKYLGSKGHQLPQHIAFYGICTELQEYSGCSSQQLNPESSIITLNSISSDRKPTEMTSSTWELQWPAGQTKSMPDNSLTSSEREYSSLRSGLIQN